MELNFDQKQAVFFGDGPMLIIAGAGTGKTRVITERVLHLVNSSLAKPSEILGLTFTEKAANEMIERIDASMSLGYEELCIKTFHSFADQIIRESGMEIGIDPGYKIIKDVDQWFFFKKNIFEFALDYYRPLGNPNRFIYDLLNHFSSLKDELITPEQYIEFAEKIVEGEDRDKTLEVARTYKKYQELLIQNNFLDFGDLLFYANKLLETRASCLKKYQDRFKYILVDEFQDTNYAQFQLVLKLAAAGKNINVVGDDDQSIYKWRGASLSNILQFQTKFPESEKIVLTDNYRSSKAILDSAYKLIQNNNPDRLEQKEGIDKKLRCFVESSEKVDVHHFPDFIQESEFVAKQIKSIHDTQGVAYGNFAVLLRANQQAHPFIDELKAHSVPYQVKSPKGLFGLSEIKDIVCVLNVIANPYDDIALLRVLKMDIFDISMAEILDLLHNGKKDPLFSSLMPDSPTIPGIGSGLESAASLLSLLIEFSKKNSVGLVINEFLSQSGILENWVKNDKFEELENLNEFAKQVSKFSREHENNSVLDFVEYLNMLEEANSVLASEQFVDRDSVQILTTHGSKGLEFDYVFVVNAVKERFPSRRRSDVFTVPEELTKEIYPEGDYHIQEERRLFYVAMTRAKKKLFITYSDQYEGNKKWKVSPFVDDILDVDNVEVFDHEAADDAIGRLKEFKEPARQIFDLPPFKKKKLSYTQLDTFKLCPLKYNYRYLMNVPVPEFHASNFGFSVHETLNEFYSALKQGKAVDFNFMAELYEKNWIPHGYDSVEHEQERKLKGLDILREFVSHNDSPWVMPAFLERPFHLKVGEFMLNGRIDRIDKLADGTYEVIDYKTGANRDENLKKSLQLSIYALACRDVLKLNVSKLSLYFLEANEKVSTTRSAAELDAVREEIIQNIDTIKGSDFSPTPGFHCQFCDFKMICPAV